MRPTTALTQKQHELIDRLLNADSHYRSSRTYSLSEIDALWYQREEWTHNTLDSLRKKGICSEVKYYLRYTNSSFEIRYHFPQVPFSCDINVIKFNPEYYEFVERQRRRFASMSKASGRDVTPKQTKILEAIDSKFGVKEFTRKQLDRLYWETINAQEGKSKNRVQTFAHQILNLIAKGRLRVLSGYHLNGTYEQCNISDQKLLRQIIYAMSLDEIAHFNREQLKKRAFSWEE